MSYVPPSNLDIDGNLGLTPVGSKLATVSPQDSPGMSDIEDNANGTQQQAQTNENEDKNNEEQERKIDTNNVYKNSDKNTKTQSKTTKLGNILNVDNNTSSILSNNENNSNRNVNDNIEPLSDNDGNESDMDPLEHQVIEKIPTSRVAIEMDDQSVEFSHHFVLFFCNFFCLVTQFLIYLLIL